MSSIARMTRAPGLGLPERERIRLATDLESSDRWYLYGLIAPYGIAGADGHPPLRRLDWGAGGVLLRDRHHGPLLGVSTSLWETDSGVFGLFELSGDQRTRGHVLGVVLEDDAAFSAGFQPTGIDDDGQIIATLAEVSLTPSPALPTVILGIYTPPQMYVREPSKPHTFTRHPGPRHAQFLAESQLLDAVSGLDDADTLATLDALPDAGGPARELAAELRSALTLEPTEQTSTPAPAQHVERRGLELAISTPLEPLELRAASDGRPELSCRCVPYDRVSRITHPPERFRYGAFAGVDLHRSKVWLRDENHARGRRPVGYAVDLTERSDGLYGVFRFANTSQGRDAAEAVREGMYGGVSVGFIATDDHIDRGIREIRAARLDHVSLVDRPAHPGADILAITPAPEPTP